MNAIAPYGTMPTGDGDISTGSRWHPNGVFATLMATRADEMSSMARRTVLERQYAYPSEIALPRSTWPPMRPRSSPGRYSRSTADPDRIG